MNQYYSVTCTCGNLLVWPAGDESPTCPGCGSHEKWQGDLALVSAGGERIIVPAAPLKDDQFKSLRDWWHQLLRNYDRYPTYAMLLALPSDTELALYLQENRKELHLLTGDICLLIALSGLGFLQIGNREKIQAAALEDHISEGYGLKAAHLFDIPYTDFPCLLLFNDIRSSEHAVIHFKGLKAQEISAELRKFFSILRSSLTEAKDPLADIENYYRNQALVNTSKSIALRVGTAVGKSLEKVLEAWIEASLKPAA